MASPRRYTKTIIALMIAMAIFLVFLDMILVSRERSKLHAEFNAQAENEFTLIETFVTEPLLHEEFTLVEQFIKQWGKRQTDIVELQAFSPHGFLLTEFKRSTPADNTALYRHSVHFRDKHLLDLQITKDLLPTENRIRRFWQQLILQSFFSTMVLGVVLWIILKVMTLRPLEMEIAKRKQTEKLLQNTKDQLEIQVEARTFKLQQQKDQWEKTFNAIPDIITLQDKNMCIVRANKAAYDFFAMKGENLIGKKCYEVFSESSEPCSGCPGLTALQYCHSHSRVIEHKRLGKTFFVSSSPIFGSNKEVQYLVHVAKDITEQKRLEEELFQAHKMEAIGTLAGGIAHDFNNILSVIIGYSEIAKLGIQTGSGDQEENIDHVLTAGKRAAELVKQILTFSRKTEHRMQPLSPHLIVKEAMKMLRSSLPTTIAIQQDIDSECGQIQADPTKIHQIVVNLCTNALHAMENEKGTLSISLGRKDVQAKQITESDVSPGDFVVLSISDTGHGMNQETIKRIFEPYFTTKEMGKGTGLGLAVIHGIIKEYKGFIEVESDLDKGTSFHVYIPALEKDSIHLDITAGKDRPLPTGTEEILIVDDEDAIVKITKKALESLGYTVTTTTDSLNALAKIRSNPNQFDLLITDQTMPNMTGSELAQEVMKIKPNMPIILSTGYSAVISEDEALAIGIKKFAKKPVNQAKIAKLVRQALDEN